MVSCTAPLSCPSPSCEAGLLAFLHAGGGDSVKAGPEGEEPPTREEEEEGVQMQANPAYLPIEMSHKMPEEIAYNYTPTYI